MESWGIRAAKSSSQPKYFIHVKFATKEVLDDLLRHQDDIYLQGGNAQKVSMLIGDQEIEMKKYEEKAVDLLKYEDRIGYEVCGSVDSKFDNRIGQSAGNDLKGKISALTESSNVQNFSVKEKEEKGTLGKRKRVTSRVSKKRMSEEEKNRIEEVRRSLHGSARRINKNEDSNGRLKVEVPSNSMNISSRKAAEVEDALRHIKTDRNVLEDIQFDISTIKPEENIQPPRNVEDYLVLKNLYTSKHKYHLQLHYAYQKHIQEFDQLFRIHGECPITMKTKVENTIKKFYHDRQEVTKQLTEKYRVLRNDLIQLQRLITQYQNELKKKKEKQS